MATTLLLLLGLLSHGLTAQEAAEQGLVRFEAKGRDIVDVINLIAKAAGEKVFIHPEVEGRVNVKIDDLPFEEALDLVLAAKEEEGYSWRKIDGVYHVGRFEEVPPPPSPGETVTETVPMRYQDARLLARLFGYVDLETLNTTEGASLYFLLPKGLTAPPQPVIPDNALILNGSSAAVSQMASLLRRIDQKGLPVVVRFQVFAATPEVVEGIKVRWEKHPKLRLEGTPGQALQATRNFREVLEKLTLNQAARLLFEPAVTTENLAPAHLSLGWSSDGKPVEPAGLARTAALPAWPTTVQPGQLVLALVPRVEPGYLIRLWFRASFGVNGPEEKSPGFAVTLVGEGLDVPPGETLALYLPSPTPPSPPSEGGDRGGVAPAAPAVRPPLLMFVTPQVVEEEG
jgi:hypothetical protein